MLLRRCWCRLSAAAAAVLAAAAGRGLQVQSIYEMMVDADSAAHPEMVAASTADIASDGALTADVASDGDGRCVCVVWVGLLGPSLCVCACVSAAGHNGLPQGRSFPTCVVTDDRALARKMGRMG